ncbi:MAG: hypothetical protein OXN21_05245 [Chloroflexota bacterium]|nr:hypothetical protein [Chloroflexota bacterium]
MGIKDRLVQLKARAVPVGGFIREHRRLILALAVGLLIVLPLLAGSGGGTFFLNLVGLGISALVVWRVARAGNRNRTTCRCNCNRRKANTQQQGGTP